MRCPALQRALLVLCAPRVVCAMLPAAMSMVPGAGYFGMAAPAAPVVPGACGASGGYNPCHSSTAINPAQTAVLQAQQQQPAGGPARTNMVNPLTWWELPPHLQCIFGADMRPLRGHRGEPDPNKHFAAICQERWKAQYARWRTSCWSDHTQAKALEPKATTQIERALGSQAKAERGKKLEALEREGVVKKNEDSEYEMVDATGMSLEAAISTKSFYTADQLERFEEQMWDDMVEDYHGRSQWSGKTREETKNNLKRNLGVNKPGAGNRIGGVGVVEDAGSCGTTSTCSSGPCAASNPNAVSPFLACNAASAASVTPGAGQQQNPQQLAAIAGMQAAAATNMALQMQAAAAQQAAFYQQAVLAQQAAASTSASMAPPPNPLHQSQKNSRKADHSKKGGGGGGSGSGTTLNIFQLVPGAAAPKSAPPMQPAPGFLKPK